MPEIDLHAAHSAWAGRAKLVEEFKVGEWSAALYEAHPDDVDSFVGHHLCVLSHPRHPVGGMISARSTKPQLRGQVLYDAGWRFITQDVFAGGVAELRAAVERTLNEGPQPGEELLNFAAGPSTPKK